MKSSPASGQGEKITVLNPRGTPPTVELIPLAPRLESLTGKTIYIVDVNFPDTEGFYEAAKAYPLGEVPTDYLGGEEQERFILRRGPLVLGRDQGRRRTAR